MSDFQATTREAGPEIKDQAMIIQRIHDDRRELRFEGDITVTSAIPDLLGRLGVEILQNTVENGHSLDEVVQTLAELTQEWSAKDWIVQVERKEDPLTGEGIWHLSRPENETDDGGLVGPIMAAVDNLLNNPEVAEKIANGEVSA